MGLGLKDGIQGIPAFHDKEYNELDIPQYHFYPGYLTILAAYIHLHGLNERDCGLPNDRYLQAIGLHAALWGEDRYGDARQNVGVNYSMVTPLINVEAVDIATTSINSCIRTLAFPNGGPYPEGITDLMHVVGELHDNVWSHGRATGFSFAQKWAVPYTDRREHYIEFALADHGLGFLSELQRANISDISTDYEAIEWCIKEGNSSKHGDATDDWSQLIPPGHVGGNVYGHSVPVREEQNNHQGLGLAHLMTLVSKYSGELFLASGSVCLVVEGSEVRYEQLTKHWQGVALSCRFKVSNLSTDFQHDESDAELNDIMRLLGGEQ